MNDVTQKNVDKVTRYREGGKKALDKLVSQFKWVMGQQQRETEKKIRKDGEKATTTLDAKQ
ncbi:50S ribosomal protein L17 [Verticillium alfalfae VaMs.102]|uniref:50S ribosomal protein L17 n=1 Tax=Verticillium alfalfae (strain VaMs.102 / ATCC MYA-4576 / FGSC 10136) TaxID=526221 RepID=C9SGM5_VERA1|nr:50S ribosomal protein L17 [Verticillium alfalfae VaMs.102]EEY18147.1 50S ribosomal protein L17 [Verticillium alfalfae VaMs.102]